MEVSVKFEGKCERKWFIACVILFVFLAYKEKKLLWTRYFKTNVTRYEKTNHLPKQKNRKKIATRRVDIKLQFVVLYFVLRAMC